MKIDNSKSIIIVLLTVIVIILVAIVVLFATNMISFNSKVNDDKKLSNENVNNDNSSNDNVTEDNEEKSWISHLLSLHLLDAKILRIRSKDLGDNEELNETVTISEEELKTYSQGRGGPDKDHLVVSYEYNDEKYEFEIFYGSISVDKLDDNFKTVLNNNMYGERNTEYKNIEGSFYFYTIDGYSETIFDEFFD